jgi:ubiquitin-like 1-activating enzyme E1 B
LLLHKTALFCIPITTVQVWSVADSARVFLTSIMKFLVQRHSELGEAVFDKDDDLAVDFVTAAANLRAACYGIPQQKR